MIALTSVSRGSCAPRDRAWPLQRCAGRADQSRTGGCRGSAAPYALRARGVRGRRAAGCRLQVNTSTYIIQKVVQAPSMPESIGYATAFQPILLFSLAALSPPHAWDRRREKREPAGIIAGQRLRHCNAHHGANPQTLPISRRLLPPSSRAPGPSHPWALHLCQHGGATCVLSHRTTKKNWRGTWSLRHLAKRQTRSRMLYK